MPSGQIGGTFQRSCPVHRKRGAYCSVMCTVESRRQPERPQLGEKRNCFRSLETNAANLNEKNRLWKELYSLHDTALYETVTPLPPTRTAFPAIGPRRVAPLPRPRTLADPSSPGAPADIRLALGAVRPVGLDTCSRRGSATVTDHVVVSLR